MERLRIGLLAPLEMRVPPVGYGGTELVVSLLAEGLVERGHEVTLFASGDSITQAKLVAGSPRFLRGTNLNRYVLSLLNARRCFERAAEFDIIHNHTMPEGLAMAGLVETPVLSTLHGNLENEWIDLFCSTSGWYNTISYSASALLPNRQGFVGVIHNAVDCASYPFNPGERDPFLLYLSRISREKGAHLAIEVARRVNKRLIIAGNVDTPDEEYFRNEVLPHIDYRQIFFVGEADSVQKRQLLSRASCLLAPITWPEPFGLFMIEAQACGTPVIALNMGAAPEVVRHERTGFVVESIEAMAEAIKLLRDISPYECRAFIEQNFNAGRMVDNYVRAYEGILGGIWQTDSRFEVNRAHSHLIASDGSQAAEIG